jgi:LmbE family N-acetylglucosaminyl deacetylase
MRVDAWWEGTSRSRPAPLHSLQVPREFRILALGPHPDDFDAVGVTMRLFRDNGNPIHVAVLSSASGVEDIYCTDTLPTPEAKSRIRIAEQRRSCRFFGLPDGKLVFPDMDQDDGWQPAVNERNANLLRTLLDGTQPDLVFLPHGNDGNTGHQATVALLAMAGSRRQAPLAIFYIRDPKTISMRVDAFVEFGEEAAAWKAELLRFHDTQQQRNLNWRGHGLDARILNVNRAIASGMGLDAPYAEAFEVSIVGPEAAA